MTDRRLYECRREDCSERFLTADARNGHESTHTTPTAPRTRRNSTGGGGSC